MSIFFSYCRPCSMNYSGHPSKFFAFLKISLFFFFFIFIRVGGAWFSSSFVAIFSLTSRLSWNPVYYWAAHFLCSVGLRDRVIFLCVLLLFRVSSSWFSCICASDLVSFLNFFTRLAYYAFSFLSPPVPLLLTRIPCFQFAYVKNSGLSYPFSELSLGGVLSFLFIRFIGCHRRTG